MSLAQQTLTGEKSDLPRETPDTFIYCEKCDEAILRSNRFDHEHDLSEENSGIDPKTHHSLEKVPEDAILDTQTYEVTFHYEVVETVVVESTSKGEAKYEAEQVQTFRGEYMDTIHTEYREIGEEGQATVEYLEDHGLLPDDHNITAADIERVIQHD
ncbi:MAG: hypothetical protein ABEI98_08830 [Halorhabdus sp.]